MDEKNDFWLHYSRKPKHTVVTLRPGVPPEVERKSEEP
jgi:hypothetical protein